MFWRSIQPRPFMPKLRSPIKVATWLLLLCGPRMFIPLLVSYLPSAPKGYFVPTRCPSNHSWAVRACFCLEVVNFGPFGVFFGNRHDLRCGTNDPFQAKCSLNLLTSASPFKVFLHQQYVSSLKYLMSLRKQKRGDGQLCTPNGSSRNKTIADCWSVRP